MRGRGRWRERLRGGAVPLALAGLIALSWSQFRDASGRQALIRSFYDYAVVDSCALKSWPVVRGFRAERDESIARLALDPAAVSAMRIHALVKADREWVNRGLGGFRGWCRTEGLNAANRFRHLWCARAPADPACG